MAEHAGPAKDAPSSDAPKRFEGWMTANLALGAAFNSFLPVLLPAYILSAGGSATDVGVAMAMVGLFALAGPTIGRIAVRYEGYRVLQVLGVLGLSAAFAILALAEGDSFTIVLGAAVLGIGTAALLVINPTFVVAAGFSKEQEARQLTSLQLNLDVGKIFGGGLLGILAGVNMKSENQFWVAAGVLLLLAGVVWAFNAGAARRIVDAARARVEASRARAAAGDDSGPSKISMRTLLLSIFGLFLLAQILATAANIVVSSQFSNIFSEVFSLGDGQISQLVTISGVLGVGLYFVAGVWMKHASPVLVWATGNALRGAGGVLLAILGAVGDMPYIAILGVYLLFESSASFARIAQAPCAVRFAPVAAAVATGWLAAGQALGQAGASLGAGALADFAGFESLLWLAGGLGLGAGALGFFLVMREAKDDSDTETDHHEAQRHGAGRAQLNP